MVNCPFKTSLTFIKICLSVSPAPTHIGFFGLENTLSRSWKGSITQTEACATKRLKQFQGIFLLSVFTHPNNRDHAKRSYEGDY